MTIYHVQRLARLVAEKEESDALLFSEDHSIWYTVNKNELSPALREKFMQFYIDEGTDKFLEESLAISNSLCLQVYYAITSAILSLVLTKTSINGVLDRGGMYLFSISQLRDFLDIRPGWIPYDKNMLDLGAGDGRITSVLAHVYSNASVTEASKVMIWRLRQRGFTVVSKDDWFTSGNYHLISALNLIDRHYNPSLLLSQIHSLASRSNSLVLIAVVLPFHQYVEFHPSRDTNRPDSIIVLKGETFEEQASSLMNDVFVPAGFHLLKWGKLPYLCEGDSKRV